MLEVNHSPYFVYITLFTFLCWHSCSLGWENFETCVSRLRGLVFLEGAIYIYNQQNCSFLVNKVMLCRVYLNMDSTRHCFVWVSQTNRYRTQRTECKYTFFSYIGIKKRRKKERSWSTNWSNAWEKDTKAKICWLRRFSQKKLF